YTQMYDFLKYNQKDVDDLRAERLAKIHDLLALMATSNNPFNYLVFHQDQPSPSTYMQQPLPINNNYNPQPSFNQNYMQQPMPNLEDITDPTTVINMAEGNAIGTSDNQIRCYNYRGLGHLARNCILMANLQQASTSGTQTDKAPVYDSDGSVEVHNYDNCYNNDIFNMFTQEEQYTELLEPISEPHQV
ncbi:hypothetical protein Tco_1574498, partial [Tanacetum coccineum]